MQGKVCVFGSFNFDIIARVERFPMPGESLVAKSSMTSAGGKGANQATAALKAGANVHYIGKIGCDDFSKFARRHLKALDFNAVTLFETTAKPTGNALIYVAGDDAENMICVDPGANITVTDEEIESCKETIACADIVLVQLENNISAIERVIDIAKKNNAFIILNPAPYQPVTNEFLSKVDLLTPNATEAFLLTGCKVENRDSAERAADLLHSRGVRQLIITLGRSGALLSDGLSKEWIPCFPSTPVDTTGAGDAFNGALAARTACADTLKQAALFAAAYAAVSVEKHGASSLPDYKEATDRLKDIRMVSFPLQYQPDIEYKDRL